MKVSQTFQGLADIKSIQPGSLPRTCIVTGELIGPFNNGGLGTSMTGLAELLAAYGGAVTVLYTGEVKGNIQEWVEQYKKAGIHLEILAELWLSPLTGPLADIGWTNAWNLYQLLQQREFDLIHFNDTMGEGMYCFVAKRCGLSFKHTLLSLAVHSPTEWILENNRHPADWPGFCCFTTGERVSIATTDLLWGPSRYLLDWLENRNYLLPEQVFQQQYVIPTDKLFESGVSKYENIAAKKHEYKVVKPREIVFFGRLEERKGIRLFVSAITHLDPVLKEQGISVVFMGKHSVVGAVSSESYLREATKDWTCDWRIENDFSQKQVIDFLVHGDRLAVMASPVDNSPCTVYEALMHGIPFIAAATGGIPELIHVQDHNTHLFSYTVNDLVKLLESVLSGGITLPRPALSIAENQLRWLNFHVCWRNYLPDPVILAEPAKWAVCIDHHGAAGRLTKTLNSVKQGFDMALVATVVSRHNMADLAGTNLDGITLADDNHPLSAMEIFNTFELAGASCLLCVRSGVEIDLRATANIEYALANKVDCLIPAAKVADMTAVMPALGGSAAFSFLEGDYDTGALLVSLRSETVRRLISQLDPDCLYLGLLEKLYAEDAVIWPWPETISVLDKAEDAVVPVHTPQRNLLAYACAPQRELYQMLAIGKRFYPKAGTFRINDNTHIVLKYIKSIVRKHPAFIRLVFGNRFSRKVAHVLYRLSTI